MASASAPGTESLARVRQLQDLYDHHRYLEAFALSADYWNPSTDLERLSTDELILAARLAGRLGGLRLSRWLFRAVLKRDPSNPRVRYFTRGVRIPGWHVLDDLRAFEMQPDLGGDDPEIRAAWYASYALSWACLRDFQRAYECLEHAHAVAPHDAWVLTCECGVHGIADRWQDALASAERAWETDQGAPFAAGALGTSLVNLGRVGEAAARLYAAAEGSQSCDLAGHACWSQCALAETLDGRDRQCALERARLLADRLPDLAPLADRESRIGFARAKLDVAALSNDYDAIERWCDQSRSPFHRQLVANLRKNRHGERIRLPFRRTLQTQEACVPASVSAAMSANGVAVSAEEMATEVTFGGTPEWAAAEWLRGGGFHVRFFAVTPELAATLIRHRIAFVLCWDAEESGHAVAVVGLDERAETLLVHDPQWFRTTEYLLAVLNPGLSPLGITGMAVVAPDRADDLDVLLPPESAIVEAAQEYRRALVKFGPSAARAIVNDLAERFPSHPGPRFLRSAQLVADGETGEGFKQLLRLLQDFPDAPNVRTRVLAACRALGNTARLREVLKGIVERGVLPGRQAEQEWIRPPARYVFEYAELLGLSSASQERAETLLHSLLARQPVSSGAWHVLAGLLTAKRDMDGALLCHRLASCLMPSDEQYARTYAAALGARGRDEEGFRWLESRVRMRGSSPLAVGTWLSWISALEDRGRPERAVAACHEALERHPHSVELLAFAVPFFARMGLWEFAEENLQALRSGENPAAFHQASVRFLQMRGDLNGAVEHARSWIAESPHAMDGRRVLLDLLATRDGPRAAAEQAALWLQANRNHEAFEQAYCAQLDRTGGPGWKKYRVLLKRLRRNPEDAWAWVELACVAIAAYDAASDEERRHKLEGLIERYMAECDRTCADSLPALRLHALWLEARHDWAGAVASLLDCIAREPGNLYGYERAWHCSARLADPERRRVWTEMSRAMRNAPGRLSIARPVLALLVGRFGLSEAEREVERWRAERPEDPDVLAAATDLLIEHGRGRSDAQRALEMLVPAVQRYPYHAGLRFSLANAYRRAGDGAEAEKVLAKIIQRHPANAAAHIQLAWVKQGNGDREGAGRVLDDAEAFEPRSAAIVAVRARILLTSGRLDDARRVIEQGLARMPEDVEWRGLAIGLFMQCRAQDQAIAAARAGVAICPRSADMWFLLAKALCDMRGYAKTGEVESCLRRSLALNAGLSQSGRMLAMWLMEQERYDEAIQVMRSVEERAADPSFELGWLALVKRRQGKTVEALRDLTTAVCDAPWFGWGWHTLAGWLDQDRIWEQLGQDRVWADAWRLVQEVPPQMAGDVVFRRRCLLLRRKAGVDRALIEAEWTQLLRDFPDDASLSARLPDPIDDGVRRAYVAETSSASRIPWWLWWIWIVALLNLLPLLFQQ